jgi:hypothetical protein
MAILFAIQNNYGKCDPIGPNPVTSARREGPSQSTRTYGSNRRNLLTGRVARSHKHYRLTGICVTRRANLGIRFANQNRGLLHLRTVQRPPILVLISAAPGEMLLLIVRTRPCSRTRLQGIRSLLFGTQRAFHNHTGQCLGRDARRSAEGARSMLTPYVFTVPVSTLPLPGDLWWISRRRKARGAGG